MADAQLKKFFDKWWPDLDGVLQAIKVSEPASEAAPKENQDLQNTAILEEVLELSRAQQRAMSRLVAVVDHVPLVGADGGRDRSPEELAETYRFYRRRAVEQSLLRSGCISSSDEVS